MSQVDVGNLNFIEKYRLNLIKDFEDELDNEVDLWHLGNGGENLYEFLGLDSTKLITHFLIGDLEDFLKEGNMVGIYRFEADYGRCGTLSGIFTASVEDIQRIHGITIYLGEALGKHSEVYFDPGDLVDCVNLVSDDPEVVDMFQKNAMWTGYDLTDYLEDE